MLNKHQVDQIDKNAPWKRDELQREAVAEYLTPLLKSIRQPFVISLHSPYGTGKSFFLECWKSDLERQGYKVVLFDAWKTDFSDDPLSAFISSVKQQAAAGDKKLGKKFVDLAKSAGGFLGSRLLPLALESISRKAIGAEGTQELIAGLNLKSHEVSSLLSAVAAEALGAQEVAEKSMEDFKKLLAQIVQNMVAGVEDADKQKLIIFVDELDRCKPSYAIEVLESIKHLFAVQNTVFVLAFDETQMRETIAQTYGLHTNGEGYLRKFIDWQFRLPAPSAVNYKDFLQSRYFSDLYIDENVPAALEEMCSAIALVADGLGFSCREMDQAFSFANLIYRSQRNWSQFFSEILGLMIACYVKNSVETTEFSGDVHKANEFISKLLNDVSSSSLKSRYGEFFSSGAGLAYFLPYSSYQELSEHIEANVSSPPLTDETIKFFRRIWTGRGARDQSKAQLCLTYITGAVQYAPHGND